MGGEVWFMCQIDAIGRSPSKIVTRQDGVYIRTYLYGCEWPCVGDSGMEWGGTWIVSHVGVSHGRFALFVPGGQSQVYNSANC